MKILILGTSNSLLRTGWVQGLRFALPNVEIDNLSIGASPGIQFSSKMNVCFSDYDYVIFDSLPNDEEYYNWNLSNEGEEDVKFFFDTIEAIVDYIRSQTDVILMLIPLKEYFYNKSSVYMHRVDYAKRYNIPVLDCSEIIDLLLLDNKIRFDDIYKYHDAHPEVSIMNLIGRELAKLIKPEEKQNKSPIKRVSPFYSVIDNNGEVIRYKNSIIDEDFVKINAGEKIELYEYNNYVGMYVNMRKTNCLLRFFDSFGNELYKISLYYKYENVPGAILKVFIPCPRKISPAYILVDSPESSVAPYRGMGSSQDRIDQEDICLTVSEVITSDKNYSKDGKILPSRREITSKVIDNINDIDDFCFFITPRVECDDMIKTVRYLEYNVQSKDKLISIMSHDESIICFDLRSWSVCRRKIYEIQNELMLKIVQIDLISNNKVKMFIDISGMRMNIDVFDSELIYFEFFGNNISFSYDGRYMCADSDGLITNSRIEVAEWEKFLLCAVI